MILDYYVFAAYVFLLVCGAIWLIGRVLKRSKKSNEEHGSYDKEQKLYTLYQNVEDMLNSFEEYVDGAKEEADQRMAKMQAMLEETRSLTAQLKATQNSVPISAKDSVAAEMPHKAVIKEDILRQSEQAKSIPEMKAAPAAPQSVPSRQAAARKSSATSNKVSELYDRGVAQNEIARRLGISVREVTLALKIRNTEEV